MAEATFYEAKTGINDMVWCRMTWFAVIWYDYGVQNNRNGVVQFAMVWYSY